MGVQHSNMGSAMSLLLLASAVKYSIAADRFRTHGTKGPKAGRIGFGLLVMPVLLKSNGPRAESTKP